MIEVLEDIVREMRETFLEPRLHRIRARLFLSVVTIAVLMLFALMALCCLFLMVFLGLSNQYGQSAAATILFVFSVVICFGTLLVHAIARRIEDGEYEAKFRAPDKRPRGRVRDHIPEDPSFMDQAREYFAENKLAGLLGVALTGIVIGARPALAFRTLGWLMGRKRRRRAREDRD